MFILILVTFTVNTQAQSVHTILDRYFSAIAINGTKDIENLTSAKKRFFSISTSSRNDTSTVVSKELTPYSTIMEWTSDRTRWEQINNDAGNYFVIQHPVHQVMSGPSIRKGIIHEALDLYHLKKDSNLALRKDSVVDGLKCHVLKTIRPNEGNIRNFYFDKTIDG
jgi:hypothetical protein